MKIGKINIQLDQGAVVPSRAHETDAGLDLYTREKVLIWGGQSHIFDTGVHIEFPPGFYGKIESKSGLNTKHGIVSAGGVIDEGFTGSICVKLYNLSNRHYIFEAEDKIAQLIIQPYAVEEGFEIVQELQQTERGDKGFGSSGK